MARTPWHRRRKDTLATSRVAAGVTGVTGVSASGASVGGGEVQAGPTQQTGTVGRRMPAAGGEGKGRASAREAVRRGVLVVRAMPAGQGERVLNAALVCYCKAGWLCLALPLQLASDVGRGLLDAAAPAAGVLSGGAIPLRTLALLVRPGTRLAAHTHAGARAALTPVRVAWKMVAQVLSPLVGVGLRVYDGLMRRLVWGAGAGQHALVQATLGAAGEALADMLKRAAFSAVVVRRHLVDPGHATSGTLRRRACGVSAWGLTLAARVGLAVTHATVVLAVKMPLALALTCLTHARNLALPANAPGHVPPPRRRASWAPPARVAAPRRSWSAGGGADGGARGQEARRQVQKQGSKSGGRIAWRNTKTFAGVAKYDAGNFGSASPGAGTRAPSVKAGAGGTPATAASTADKHASGAGGGGGAAAAAAEMEAVRGISDDWREGDGASLLGSPPASGRQAEEEEEAAAAEALRMDEAGGVDVRGASGDQGSGLDSGSETGSMASEGGVKALGLGGGARRLETSALRAAAERRCESRVQAVSA